MASRLSKKHAQALAADVGVYLFNWRKAEGAVLAQWLSDGRSDLPHRTSRDGFADDDVHWLSLSQNPARPTPARGVVLGWYLVSHPAIGSVVQFQIDALSDDPDDRRVGIVRIDLDVHSYRQRRIGEQIEQVSLPLAQMLRGALTTGRIDGITFPPGWKIPGRRNKPKDFVTLYDRWTGELSQDDQRDLLGVRSGMFADETLRDAIDAYWSAENRGRYKAVAERVSYSNPNKIVSAARKRFPDLWAAKEKEHGSPYKRKEMK